MSETYKITEEDIALYISGELSSEEELRVLTAAEEDPKLMAYINKLKAADQILVDNLGEAYPMPESFKRVVEDVLNSQSQKRPSIFANVVNLRNLVSGGIGAGIVAALLFGFGTTQMAYRSSNEISTFNYPQLYEWTVSERLAIQFSVFNTDQTFKNIVVGENSKIKVGEFFRISVLPLEDGNFELAVVSEGSEGSSLIKKTRAVKGQVLSHPVQKISGPGKHEFRFTFNDEVLHSVVLQIEE